MAKRKSPRSAEDAFNSEWLETDPQATAMIDEAADELIKDLDAADAAKKEPAKATPPRK